MKPIYELKEKAAVYRGVTAVFIDRVRIRLASIGIALYLRSFRIGGDENANAFKPVLRHWRSLPCRGMGGIPDGRLMRISRLPDKDT